MFLGTYPKTPSLKVADSQRGDINLTREGVIERVPLEKERRVELVGKYQTHEKDTGSPEVQVALLTERIRSLTEHLNANKKDQSSRRGLQKMVGQRRRILKYLSRIDLTRYQQLIAQVGLRR